MPASGRTVVIIEHDAAIRELYERALVGEFRVQGYANVQGAAEFLRSHPVVAVVLEPAQTRGGGWAFVDELRADEEHRGLPVVICSSSDDRVHAREVGVMAYLIKPVRPSVLLSTLRNLLGEAGNRTMHRDRTGG
jgi:DNA-binding response OmpR family regulator